MKVLIDLFDYSGNNARPYRENGWVVLQVDIKHGLDVLTWDYKQALYGIWHPKSTDCNQHDMEVGIIADVPCTHYALSGARHFATKDRDGRTAKMNKLVDKVKEIIDYVENNYNLIFWRLENPMSRIHKINTWLGNPKYKFNPCDHALDNPIDPEKDRYNKNTWIWGKFNNPVKNRLEPIYKENPGWKLYGGKSERTKELRSITPLGFCYAFYNSNN